MANKAFAIPRLDDQVVLTLFRELNAKHAASDFHLDPFGLELINLREQLDEGKQNIINYIDRPGSYLIATVRLGYQNFSISYSRGGDSGRKNVYVDEIAINGGNGGFPVQSRLDLLGTVNRFFISKGIVVADSTPDAEENSALDTTYRSTVLKLEAKFAEQIEKITSWTVLQAQAYEERKLELANETQTEREKLRAEHEAKLDDIRRQLDELEERRKALDDRDYMHARRAIRGDLQKTIQDRQQKFSLTSDTRRLRWPIHVVMIGLLAFLIFINGVYLEQLARIDLQAASWSLLLWAFGKQGLAAVALIGATFYYVRWLNRWFEQHSAAEFWLKQFQLDFDRASWVVESALEWRRDQKTEIPVPLLEGITRNLFQERDQSAERPTAADDLASALVGNASQVKLRVGENEISLDRKGLVGLAKTDTTKTI